VLAAIRKFHLKKWKRRVIAILGHTDRLAFYQYTSDLLLWIDNCSGTFRADEARKHVGFYFDLLSVKPPGRRKTVKETAKILQGCDVHP
jgi:outer membrane protein OmpA-like peptidoglycan-associated protein